MRIPNIKTPRSGLTEFTQCLEHELQIAKKQIALRKKEMVETKGEYHLPAIEHADYLAFYIKDVENEIESLKSGNPPSREMWWVYDSELLVQKKICTWFDCLAAEPPSPGAFRLIAFYQQY